MKMRGAVAGILAFGGRAIVRVGLGQGTEIPIPNGSFESPSTPFVSVNIDAWEKTTQPPGYDASGGFIWAQLVGAFVNTPEGQPDHISNLDGNQAIWIFAVPGIGIFQDYDSLDWNHPMPTHAFDAAYEVGTAYRFTVAVGAGEGGMLPGATLQISLYYRDAASNLVSVAGTTITNAFSLTNSVTRLTDYQVTSAVVQPRDAWAGRKIGVRILSTVGNNLQGGYWDVDHARLTAFGPPKISPKPLSTASDLSLTWPSAAGLIYQLRVSSNLKDWTNSGAPIPGTGLPINQVVTTASGEVRFFSVEASPQTAP